MKTIALIFCMLITTTLWAQSEGICKASRGSEHMAQLCKMQGQGWSPKSTCEMTNGCDWVSTKSYGVCTNTRGNEHMALLCRNQGNISNGDYYCKMTTGCQWVELD